MDHFQTQYALTRQSREILLGFLAAVVGEAGINTPISSYMDKSIRGLLVHSASCYFHWLAYLALRQPRGSINETGTSLEELRGIFGQVDDTMSLFLLHFSGSMDQRFEAVHDDGWRVWVTPAELFTHVTTHEFHHKGQIVLMARMLGHAPPDTDVSNAFDSRPPV
jgi:uncharacterized damage-inducible protein DinB